MKLLGAIIAGGASRRFGSDKALAEFAGKPLIEHVIAGLLPQVERLVIVGRDHPGFSRIDDRPAPDMGPIGGLCGALNYGQLHNFDAVLCAPCDTPGLPADLAARLSPGPSVALGQRIIGLWPISLAPVLVEWLAGGGSRALHAWVTVAQAREVDCGRFRNINHAGDLGPA